MTSFLNIQLEVLFNIVMDMYKLALDLRRSNNPLSVLKKRVKKMMPQFIGYTSIFSRQQECAVSA